MRHRGLHLCECDTRSYLTSAHTQNLSHLFPLRIIPLDASCITECSQPWGRKVTITMPLTHTQTLKWSRRSMEEKEAVLDEFCLICSPSVITTLPSLLLTSCLLSPIPQDTTRVTNTAVELQWCKSSDGTGFTTIPQHTEGYTSRKIVTQTRDFCWNQVSFIN